MTKKQENYSWAQLFIFVDSHYDKKVNANLLSEGTKIISKNKPCCKSFTIHALMLLQTLKQFFKNGTWFLILGRHKTPGLNENPQTNGPNKVHENQIGMYFNYLLKRWLKNRKTYSFLHRKMPHHKGNPFSRSW